MTYKVIFPGDPEGTTPRRLPIVEIDGKRFFRDDRLGEFRNIHDPNDRLLLREVEEGD